MEYVAVSKVTKLTLYLVWTPDFQTLGSGQLGTIVRVLLSSEWSALHRDSHCSVTGLMKRE